MSSLPRQQPLVRESLVVLSHDELLIQSLQTVAIEHDLFLIGSEADLATHLLSDHVGVAVIDAACVTTPIAQLTERLRAQFPDLVLVVAGGAEDQAALAAQITDGTIYRFLHKPVSEQRVKLFIDAAWRRHGEEYAGMTQSRAALVPDRASGPPRTALLLLGAAAVAAIGLTLWFFLREPDAGTHMSTATIEDSAPAAQPERDEVLEELLSRADQALARGALVTPKGESAADLYAQALERNRADPRASEGLAKVIDRLLTEAEKALLEERTDDAERFTAAARAIQPDNVRVAFLTVQIGKERERAVLARARQAAASGNIEEAIAVLDGATRGGSRSTLVAEARQELVERRFDDRVRDYLRRASEQMRRGALLEPAQNNARFFIESARALAPDDPGVQSAQAELRERLIAQARSALAAGNADEGERWIQAVGEAGASRDTLAALNREAQRVRVAARAEAMARLSQLFNQRLSEGRLVEPANDSAKFYLAQLTQTEVDHPSVRLARDALTSRMLEEARGALRREDFAGARRWLSEAREAGASATGVATVEQEILAAQDAARRANEIVNASSLERVRYVAPEYPRDARERGISGWVDLEFTVMPDGSVADVTIVSAEPVGVFEQAAIQAVSRWRYRPVERDGNPVDARARLRIRFTLE